MDWLEKIPNWIRIPLKILLPALCLFSGFLLIASDSVVDKLYLKTFREQNGFAFGLIFTITLSLIIVYILFFALKPLYKKFRRYLAMRNYTNQIIGFQSAEAIIIYGLYNEPSHAYSFPMEDPTINLLSKKGFVFTYNQPADTNSYFSTFGVIWVLQPFAIEILDKLFTSNAKEIKRLERKIIKCSNPEKKKILESDLEECKNYISTFKNINLDKYYRGDEE